MPETSNQNDVIIIDTTSRTFLFKEMNLYIAFRINKQYIYKQKGSSGRIFFEKHIRKETFFGISSFLFISASIIINPMFMKLPTNDAIIVCIGNEQEYPSKEGRILKLN